MNESVRYTAPSESCTDSLLPGHVLCHHGEGEPVPLALLVELDLLSPVRSHEGRFVKVQELLYQLPGALRTARV